MPLHIKGQIGGVLAVQSYDADVAYQASDVHLLSFVARHVSTAIARKQSYDALRVAHLELKRETHQRRQSEAMYRVFYPLAVQAAQSESLFDFCAKVHELIAQLMVAPCCFISLIDRERNVKNYPYDVDPLDAMFFVDENVPMRLGLTEFVFTTELPQRAEQARLAQLNRDGLVTQAQGDLGFSAWLGVPLRIRGNVNGVLAIRSYGAGVVYTETDAEVLAHVAHHVSGAIARMQAFEAVHRSELALRRTTFEREAMLNTALVGISFNVQDRIVWVNEKCAEMAGFQREELMGQSPRIFYESDEAFAAERAKSETSLHKHGTYNSERHTLRQNGERIWVLLAGRCVEVNDPDAGVIWTLLDVTARRQVEDDIRQALERQRELNVLRSRFVAMTSHEFRTPLATILSSAELLECYSDRMPEHEKAEVIQSIERSVQRMARMLDRVLLIGKVEEQMLEFKPNRVDLVPLCLALVEEARTQWPDSPCTVRTEFGDGVGWGVYDGKLLGHIFGNLLSNAIKYSPQGGEVGFKVYRQAHETVFEVSDQGIGIPNNEIAHLFESFHRSSNVGNIQGIGQGLAIVKNAVDLHGGRITVESGTDHSTCFRITLSHSIPSTV